MRVQTHVFGRTIRALATSPEMKLQTLLHVIVEIPVSLTGVAEAEIGGPALEIPIKILDEGRDRFETKPAAGHIPQRCPFLLQGLLRGNHIEITIRAAVPVPIVSKRVSQKVQTGSHLFQIDKPRFLTVEF